MRKIRVGLVGCGKICGIYFEAPRKFPWFEIVACCDLNHEVAQARAEEFGISRVLTLEEMMGDPAIDLILNLTIPAAHAAVTVAALNAGKAVYNEKPLAVTRREGRDILTLAAAKNLRVGCAPDTFLGAGIQTCRKLLDEGAIGDPVAATAFMMTHGPESWHPNPDFFYQPGAGPLFDMGPYYLTALINLIGPVRRVCSSARASFAEREIGSEPRRGQKIRVTTPTHVVGTLDFANGAIVSLITSFDIWAHRLPQIEIYGTKGSMSIGNPNTFGGPILLRRAGQTEWKEELLQHSHAENSRGLGLADMVMAMGEERPHRASAEMAYHVLDTMHALLESSQEDRHVRIESTCLRPEALPVDATFGPVSP